MELLLIVYLGLSQPQIELGQSFLISSTGESPESPPKGTDRRDG